MLLFIISLMILIDRSSKFWAIKNLKGQNSVSIIGEFFQLSYVENSGAAFGMLKNARWFFLIFTVLVLFGLFFFYWKHRHEFNSLKVMLLAFFVGGTVGNLIDRWQWGYVVDFFSINIGRFSFPVFNIADIGITLSVLIFIFLILKEEKEENNV